MGMGIVNRNGNGREWECKKPFLHISTLDPLNSDSYTKEIGSDRMTARGWVVTTPLEVCELIVKR